MIKLYIVTAPRSGHNWMKRLVEQTATPPEFWHRDIYEDAGCALNECIKDHDFGLTSASPAGIPVMLVYREDWMAGLQSWYDLGIKQGYWPDTLKGWRNFAAHKIYWYDAFVKKWRERADVIQTYEERRADPQAALTEILDKLGYHQEREIEEQVVAHRETSAYRHFDPNFDIALRRVHQEL